MFGTEKQKTGYPSIDKPWLKFYDILRRKASDKGAYIKIERNRH